jgi:plastocyanin
MTVRQIVAGLAVIGALTAAGCGDDSYPMAPSPDPPTANVYILPGAADLGPNAFGDHPIVIYKGERMHWTNADSEQHHLVADTRGVPEFAGTNVLDPGGEQSFILNTTGQTLFHCTIHPQMVGTLIVQEP